MHLRPNIHHLLCEQIPKYLTSGKLPAWEIEDRLAKLFNVSDKDLLEMHPNTNTPVWRNDVAWALSELVHLGQITKLGNERAPSGKGGVRGIYMLKKSSSAPL
jgi:Mrr N-terminal domain